MPRRVKAVSHEDRLTLVEHLDELRSRLIVSLAIFGVALALCFWQNHLLLEIASGPLPCNHKKLLTFGVTEPFTTTLTVAAYGALVLSLPFVLYQLYAYVLPAFSRAERRVVLPILLLVPAPLPRRRRLRLLRRDAGRGPVPARLQQQPVQRPGPRQRLLQLLLDDDAGLRTGLPAAAGDRRRHPPRHRQGRAAQLQPPLRLPRDLDHRRGPARRRPDLDAASRWCRCSCSTS